MRLQRHGSRSPGTQLGGSLQLLQPKVLIEDSLAARRPADLSHRVHPRQVVHPP